MSSPYCPGLLAGTGTCGSYGTSVEVLASRANTDVSAVLRLLRALESIGIFVQVSPRIFSNTAASECLRKDVPGSQWPTVVHCLSKGSGPFEGWNELEYALRTGEPSVDKVYGHDFWELLRHNPQANAAMNGAMRSASAAMTPVVTAAYKRAAARRVWQQFARAKTTVVAGFAA